MANIFALLGLRALFVLVEGLIRRFRYLDETIAVVLALVAVKLLIEDLYKIGPVASLAIVGVAFAIGIIASLIADARDPEADAKRAERAERTTIDSADGPEADDSDDEPEPEADGSRLGGDGTPLRRAHPDDGERGGDDERHEAGDQRAPAQRGQER
jgi:tellurite resistance protein TerC